MVETESELQDANMAFPIGQDVSHEAISSYFIGPRAENLKEFRDNITTILDELQLAREQYFQEDVVRHIPPIADPTCTQVPSGHAY